MTIQTNQQRQPTPLTPTELTEVISRLGQILEFENELLELKTPQAMTEHQAEKTRLVSIYNQQMSLISQDPGNFKRYPKAEIDRLKAVSQGFYEILDIHFRKLSSVKSVTEGLVKAVADEVAKKKAPPNTYNAAANFASTVSSRNSKTLNSAISLNQVV